MAARAAQNRWRLEFRTRPHRRNVISKVSVTLVTRKPIAAAFEFDRDDIALAMIMSAPRLRIDIDADNLDPVDCFRHVGTRSRGQTSTRMAPMIQQAIIIAKPLVNEPLC
jgi:hypothetical protein